MKTIADAPAVLNTNDKAMWVLGWNECAAALSAPAQAAAQVPMTWQQLRLVHNKAACLPDLVGLKDQWPEIVRFARAIEAHHNIGAKEQT